jgi:thiol-disulfide isomerase/thioredoxin
VLALAAMVATLAGLATHWWWLQRTDAGPQDIPALLAATLSGVEGQPQNLNQYRGKVLVINFWATWCAPCREEMPDLIKLQARYGDRGLQLVGVAIDEPTPVKAYLRETPANYPILIAGFRGIEHARQAGDASGSLPFTLVLDRSANRAAAYLGQVDPRRLEATLLPLL